MLFPSKLKAVEGKENVQVTHLNDNYNTKHSLDTSKDYFFVADRTGTYTVYRLYYDPNVRDTSSGGWGQWYFQDASEYQLGENATKKPERVGWYQSYSNDAADAYYQIYEDGDNGRTRQYYLKQSLAAAIKDLKDASVKLNLADGNASPKINVAWNTFAENVYPQGKGVDFVTVTPSSQVGPSDSDFTTHWYTSTDRALNAAAGFSWDNIDGDQKYAILITDGAPQRNGKAVPKTDVEAAANNLKTKADLISVGLSMSDVTIGSELLDSISSRDAGGSLFYRAESGDELEYIIREIIRKIMVDAIVVGDVQDEIDTAFYPVDQDGNALNDGAKINLDGTLYTKEDETAGKSYGTIKKTGDTYTVTWPDQDMPWEGWRGSVLVKAKEDFLGGNTINTNVAASITPKGYKVTEKSNMIEFIKPERTEDKTKQNLTKSVELETPYVNVDELRFTEHQTEVTVKLGTEVDSMKAVQDLWETIEVSEVVTASDGEHRNSESMDPDRSNPETFLLKDVVTLTEEDWVKLLKGEPVTKDYTAYGHDAGQITIDLKQEIKEGETGLAPDGDKLPGKHKTTLVGDEVEKYTLTVLYEPNDADTTKDYHTTPGGEPGAFTNNITSTNVHIVNVIKDTGKIHVEKIWQDSERNNITSDSTKHPNTITYDIYRIKHVHEWVEIERVEATEEAAGYIDYQCRHDEGHTYREEIPQLEHTHTYVTTTVEPTCTEQGYDLHVCNKDESHQYKDNYVAARGHAWGEWSVTEPATCEKDGQKELTCSRCDEKEIRTISALGHDWDEGVVTTEARPGVPGVMTYTCSHDPSHTRTEEIPALPNTVQVTIYNRSWDNGRYTDTYRSTVDVPVGFECKFWVLDQYNGELGGEHGVFINGQALQRTNGDTKTKVIDQYNSRTTEAWAVEINSETTIIIDWGYSGEGYYIDNIPSSNNANSTTSSLLQARKAKASAPRKEAPLPATTVTGYAPLDTLIATVGYTDTDGDHLYYYSEIYKTGETLGPNSWTASYDVDLEDEDGNAWTYYFVETAPSSGWLTTYGGQEAGLKEDGKTTITNREEPKTGTLRITKDLFGVGTGYGDKLFKVTIKITLKNGDVMYLQSDRETFGNTAFEFEVSKNSPLEISNLPIGTYTVEEITGDDVTIANYLWNGMESTSSGTGEVKPDQTTPVELKNCYIEEYTPTPSDTNQTTDLVIDKDWVKKDGSTVPADTDNIKIKIRVKSADAYIPVQWNLYDAGATTPNADRSGIVYVQKGKKATFKLTRSDDYVSSGGDVKDHNTSWSVACNVPLVNNKGESTTFSYSVPIISGSYSGGLNSESKVFERYAVVDQAIKYEAQPIWPGARWVAGAPNAKHQWQYTLSIEDDAYYTDIDSMRNALITDAATMETLVYAMDKDGIYLVEDDTTSYVSAGTATFDVNDWVATLGELPTYQKITQGGVTSYRVYSYEIEEIEVNGKPVVNGRTDDYIVTVEPPADGSNTTKITNTEIQPVSLDIIKVDKDNTEKKLSGAVFTLYQLKDEEPTEGGTLSYENADGVASAPTARDTGKTTFENLTNGYYEIRETTPPAGYVLAGDATFYVKVQNGAATFIRRMDGKKPSEWEAATDGGLLKYENAQAEVPADPDNGIEAKAAVNATVTVANEPGVALPSTGGIGTGIFYILGSILMLGAGVLLIRRRTTI